MNFQRMTFYLFGALTFTKVGIPNFQMRFDLIMISQLRIITIRKNAVMFEFSSNVFNYLYRLAVNF